MGVVVGVVFTVLSLMKGAPISAILSRDLKAFWRKRFPEKKGFFVTQNTSHAYLSLIKELYSLQIPN